MLNVQVKLTLNALKVTACHALLIAIAHYSLRLLIVILDLESVLNASQR